VKFTLWLNKTVDAVEVVRKPVRGYEGKYVVDQFGRVCGVNRTVTVIDNGRIYEKPITGKPMKQSVHTKGYKTVTLTKDGKTKPFTFIELLQKPLSITRTICLW
jgi:hypothetical protein